MRTTASTVTKHTQTYVREVFADRLLEEGFVSPDNKDFCWYRVIGKEIVNSICFYTRWAALPVILDISYGIHPLFVEPFQPKGVYIYDYPFNIVNAQQQPIRTKQDSNTYQFSLPNAMVSVPAGSDRGLYTLDGIILPIMNAVQTPQACYELHKAHCLADSPLGNYTIDQKMNRAPDDFMDMVIYFDDVDMYPHCRNKVLERIQNINKIDDKYLRTKPYQESLCRLEQLKRAFCDGGREEHLAILEQRKVEVIKTLEKKMHIVIE